MERPLISIIIPAYNESARIGKALAEVLRCVQQRDWHAGILVVDDGSTDGSAAIVEEFAQLHPEVRLLKNLKNRGQGFSVCNGSCTPRVRSWCSLTPTSQRPWRKPSVCLTPFTRARTQLSAPVGSSGSGKHTSSHCTARCLGDL